MKTKQLVPSIVLFLVLQSCGLHVLANPQPNSGITQESNFRDTEINRLRTAIRELQRKEQDETLSADLKALNRQFLDGLKNQLAGLLSGVLHDLRTYQDSVRASITFQMNQVLEERAQDLEKEIASLKPLNATAAISDTTATATATSPPAAPETTRPRTSEAARPVAPESARPAPEAGEANRAASAATPPQSTGSNETQAVVLASQSPAPVPVVDDSDLQDCANYQAHPKQFSLFAQYVCSLSKDITDNKRTLNLLDDIFKVSLLIIAKKDRPAFIVEAEEARTDKQVGGGPSSNGSTSLVVKGSAPTVLGLAVENGALSQSVSGTTVTFRGNPLGIIQALSNKGFIQSYDDSEKYAITRILKKSSFSFSFDTSRGATDNNSNVLRADKQQLSEVTFKYEFYNKRDPRNRAYKETWERFVAAQGVRLAGSVNRMVKALTEIDPDDPNPNMNLRRLRLKDPALRSWFVGTNSALRGVSDDQVERIVRERLVALPVNSLSSETNDFLNQVRAAFEDYVTERNKILDQISKGGIVSFEYTNKREVNAPDLSNFNLIAEKGLGGKFDGTFNGSLTIFNKIPSGMTKRVRDFNFAGQGDVSLGDVRGIGNIVLSFSGRYQRLMEDAMTPDGMGVMNTKGDIVFGQAKLTIPIKGLGAKIPISFTVSNRTELIKEKEVRGNFGLTFDLDSIFAKFKP